MLDLCVKNYKKAYAAFSKINHQRGVALASRGMVEAAKRHSKIEQNVSRVTEQDSDDFDSVDLSANESDDHGSND